MCFIFNCTYKLELGWKVEELILTQALEVDNMRRGCLVPIIIITTGISIVFLSRVLPALSKVVISSTFV